MDPVQTTMTVLAGVNHALSLTKHLRDADLTFNEAGHKLKIAELYVQLSNILGDVASLKAEMLAKNEKIQELEKKMKFNSEMTWRDPFYFKVSEEKEEGPFCQRCWDTERKPVRLPKTDSSWYLCKSCSSSYDNPNHTTEPIVMDHNYDPYGWMG